MRRALTILLLGLLANSIATGRDAFESSLRQLGSELTIPGMAFAVISDGKVVSTGQVNANANTPPLTIDTPLRFASVTKALTAVALMRAVDRGALSLDDSASKWMPTLSARPEITVRHLAAHVSEGTPGAEYVYATGRYAKLGPTLTAALKADSFEQVLRKEVLAPSKMTWRESPDLGAHAGFVSTVSDMALFVQALQQGRLLNQKRFDEMTTPFTSSTGAALPVGVGFFSQQLGGERVVWSFGQDDPDHSSALLLMVPKRKLALVLLASSDELSNPFRLLMGDVRYSPFATAFLDAYAPELGQAIGERERLTHATLISIWNENGEQATEQVRQLSQLGEPRPDDFALHFIVSSLGIHAWPDFAEKLDVAVMASHPANRWALLMSGEINSGLGHHEVSARRFEGILALPNQEADGLATLFRAWSFAGLARNALTSDPKRALQYVEQGLATGVTGGTRDELVRFQKTAQDWIRWPQTERIATYGHGEVRFTYRGKRYVFPIEREIPARQRGLFQIAHNESKALTISFCKKAKTCLVVNILPIDSKRGTAAQMNVFIDLRGDQQDTYPTEGCRFTLISATVELASAVYDCTDVPGAKLGKVEFSAQP